MLIQRPMQHQRRALVGRSTHGNRPLVDRRGRLCVALDFLVQIRVIGAPEQVADADALEIDGVVGEIQFQVTIIY